MLRLRDFLKSFNGPAMITPNSAYDYYGLASRDSWADYGDLGGYKKSFRKSGYWLWAVIVAVCEEYDYDDSFDDVGLSNNLFNG